MADSHRDRALDGVRALAVAGVIAQHTWTPHIDFFAWWSPGPAGVRLFFVLSAFLITGILMQARVGAERAGLGAASVWRRFLVRRALRIFPLAYLAMVVAAVIGTPSMWDHGWSYVFYAANVRMGLDGHADAGLSHFWSLAVEEQFYLVWPVLILWLPRVMWRPLIVAVMVVVFGLRIVTGAEIGPLGAYMLPWSRMDALALGGLLAMMRIRPRLLVLAGVALVAIAGVLGMPAPVRLSLTETGAVLCSGALVVAVANGGARRILSWAPLVYLGTISYGLYVWSGLVPYLLTFIGWLAGVSLFPESFGVTRLFVVSVVSVMVSAVSWRYIERPLNGLRRHVPYVGPSPILDQIAWRGSDPQAIDKVRSLVAAK